MKRSLCITEFYMFFTIFIVAAFFSGIYSKSEDNVFKHYEYADLSDLIILGEYIK